MSGGEIKLTISIVFCALYYYVWIVAIPKWRGFRYRQAVIVLDDGAVTHSLTRVPVDELEVWDAKHDVAGRSVDSVQGLP